MFLVDVLRLLAAMAAAFLLGKVAARLGLPAILGWLIAGMALGPHAVGLLGQSVLDAQWYKVTESLLECTAGLMIGTELIGSKLRRSGRQIMVTTVTESLGTFLAVSLVFALIFSLTDIPVYLAFIFGGIALATAPAPSLSIVNGMGASGPVTSTLIPMAVLDDLVGSLVFFIVVAMVAASISAGDIPVFLLILLVFFPVLLGAATGYCAGRIMGRITDKKALTAVMVAALLLTAVLGLILNTWVFPVPVLNFLLLGMAFSAAFANMVSAQQLEDIMKVMNPVIGVALIVLILNLGAPLDYHLVFGAGLYTAVYVVSRAVGKYAGAYFGAAVTKAPPTVKKYLGFTLLPHSGVSLVFTGIAVSVLQGPAPECASLLQGTIAAAAVINEFIAVFLAKKGFEWAGELPEGRKNGKTSGNNLRKGGAGA